MTTKLLTVEDRFAITGRGLVVVPGPLMDEYEGPPGVDVELRRPDGTVLHARASISYAFLSPLPNEPRHVCLLKALSKEEVPIGTEVWYEVEGSSGE